MCRMEWHWQLPFAKYGEAWRQGRRLLDRSLRPGAAATYRPVQEAGARVLLTRLLATPNEWKDHIELCENVFFVI
jgi:cytochrome P450